MIRKEADEETKYVQNFCKNIGIECFVKKIHETTYIKQFAIYNSPVMAPSKADFFCQQTKCFTFVI